MMVVPWPSDAIDSDEFGTGRGLTAYVEPSSGDKQTPVIQYRRGTVADVLDKATVLSHLGTPTEVVGLAPNGDVVTKQPFAGDAQNRKGIQDHLRAIGAARVTVGPFKMEMEGPGPRPGRHFGRWVVNIGDSSFLITDLHNANIRANNSGDPRPTDLIVGRIGQKEFDQYPALKDAYLRAKPISPERSF